LVSVRSDDNVTVTVTVTGGTCIAPPTRRPRAHHRVNPYPGARRQNVARNSVNGAYERS